MEKVNTSKYEASHTRLPSGTGNWYFEVDGKVVNFNGTYTEAKKWATRQGGKVTVMP